jgi:2-dehydro-3-deoxyphosphogalactonate aldolase
MSPVTPWPTRLPLIAILRGIRPDEVLDHVQALIDSGFDAIEIPLNSPDWAESVRRTAQRFGAQALIGAGTMLNSDDVAAVLAAGGRLMVSPSTQPDTIRFAVARGMVTCIGCMTPTEAFDALHAGAQALKVFPAGALGPDYIRAIKAVLPADLPLFAVGGVTPGNLADYLAAGCLGAGLGGDLYRPGQHVAATAEHARAFVASFLSFQKAPT